MFEMLLKTPSFAVFWMAFSLLLKLVFSQEDFLELELPGQLSGSLLRYKVNPTDERAAGSDTVSVILTVPATAWLSFGFSDNGGFMTGSEAVIGFPGTGEVKKYSLSGRSISGVTPMPDNQQTLIDASIQQTESSTTLRFTKILAEEGEITIDGNGFNTFLSAYGTGNTLGFHRARVSYRVDLGIEDLDSGEDSASEGVTEVTVDTQSLWKWHGWFASMAWAVLSPLAVSAAVLRDFLPGDALWFQIHRALNLSTILCTVLAFGVAVAAVNQQTQSGSDAKHFDPDLADWHRTNGLVIFVLALVQAINGLLRPHLPEKQDASDAEKQESEEEKSTNRKWWEVGHRLLGIFLLGLCWYQIQLGIKRYNVLYNGGDTESTVLTIFWAVISTFGFIFVVGSLMKILKRNEER